MSAPTQRDIIANALVYVHLSTGLDPKGFLAPLAEYLDNYVIVRPEDLVPDSPAALTGGTS